MNPASGWYLEIGGRRTALGRGQTVVGRGGECELVVTDATVSRNHALLSVDGSRLTLQDLDSANGTFVGGERVRGEVTLAAGARLRFGRVRAEVGRGPVPEAAVSARYCIGCGVEVPVGADTCPRCGEPLDAERRMSRSEAIGVSEVLPVGEALAAPARGLDETRPPFPLSWDGDLDATGVRSRPGPAGTPREEATTSDPWAPDSWASLPGAPDSWSPDPGASDPAEPAPPSDGEVADAARPAPQAPEAAVAEEPALPVAAEVTLGAPASDEDAEEPIGNATADRLAQSPRYLPAAGFWPRSAAAVVDGAWITAAGGAVAAGLVVSGAAGVATAGAVGTATAVLVWLLASVVGWSRQGTTPGKRLLHLWVCDLDGRPGIGTGRALGRWLACLLTLGTAGIGFLVVGLSASRRALHDRLAGTYVGSWVGPPRDRKGG